MPLKIILLILNNYLNKRHPYMGANYKMFIQIYREYTLESLDDCINCDNIII